jgi:hypothetical protein
MAREAAFGMLYTTIPEIKSRILTTHHPQWTCETEAR